MGNLIVKPISAGRCYTSKFEPFYTAYINGSETERAGLKYKLQQNMRSVMGEDAQWLLSIGIVKDKVIISYPDTISKNVITLTPQGGSFLRSTNLFVNGGEKIRMDFSYQGLKRYQYDAEGIWYSADEDKEYVNQHRLLTKDGDLKKEIAEQEKGSTRSLVMWANFFPDVSTKSDNKVQLTHDKKADDQVQSMQEDIRFIFGY